MCSRKDLEKFLQSEQDFAFLIAPFAGLVEFFIPFALVNWFLFRKREFTGLNHITLNIYIAGFLLIYSLPFFLLLYVLGTFTSIDGDYVNLAAYITVIIVPLLYYCWVYVKVFEKKRFLSFAKPFTTIVVISYLSISFFLNEPFHEFLHRKLFYSKHIQFNIQPSPDATLATYTLADTLVRETSAFNFFSANQVRITTISGNAFVRSRYSRNQQDYTYNLVFTTPDSTKSYSISKTRFNYPQFFSVYQLKSLNRFYVLYNDFMTVFSDTVKLVSLNLGESSFQENRFTDHLSVLSIFTEVDDQLVFSGIQRGTKVPLLGILNADASSVVTEYLFPARKDFIIDALSAPTGSNLQWILSHDHNGKLKEVVWMSGVVSPTEITATNEISLYKNEFSPTKDFYNGLLHNSKLATVTDSTSIVGFQIMTDSSFALSITKINTLQKKIDWNNIVTIPSDLAYNDELVADANGIYLLGRAASVFKRGLSMQYHQQPYVAKLNLTSGMLEKIYFLEIEKGYTGYFLPNLELIYSVASSVCQDKQYIYWSLNGRHNYKIDKQKL